MSVRHEAICCVGPDDGAYSHNPVNEAGTLDSISSMALSFENPRLLVRDKDSPKYHPLSS
jgi:hypothetical protein